MKKGSNRQAVLAALSMAAALLTGCGSGGSSAAPQTVTGPVKNEAPFEAAADGAAPAFSPAGEVYYEEPAYENDSAFSEETAAAKTDWEESGTISDMGSETASSAIQTSRRKLIRNVDISMETNDFDNLLPRINSRIKELGGYVEQSSVIGQRTNYLNEPIPRNACLTARIPSEHLDSFLNSVEENANVLHRTESTQDVTLKYSDIESRKKSLTIEQDRIWALLEKAENLDSIIMLEQRLSDIRYELESMESQLRLYDNQVDYSTVALSIDEVTDFTPTAPETVWQRIRNRFLGSLSGVKAFCVNLMIVLAGTSPVWVPIVLILCLAGVLLKKRLVKKRKGNWTPSRSGENTSSSAAAAPPSAETGGKKAD